MKKNLKNLILIASVAVIAAGCASAPSKFYTLNSTAKSDDGFSSHCAVVVGPVTIPTEVDRPQFTVQIAPNRVAIDEFNRWAEPLNENIARVIAADLSTLLGTPRVTAVPLANLNPDYRVSLAIQKFESKPGQSVQIEALWTIRQTAEGATFSGRTVADEPVTNQDYSTLAAAHSRALAKVSADIAAVIQSDLGTKQ